MHSRYKISNSSDAFNLDVGVPSIQTLNSDKLSEEVRIYCEPTLECQRIKSLEEERLSNTTETLLVEPYYFNLSFTPLTQEFLAQEKKRKVRAENAQNNKNLLLDKTKEEVKESKPVSAYKLERLKNLEKKSNKEISNARQLATANRKSLNLPKDAPKVSDSPLAQPKLPPLPTAPIPASELPPQSVRIPPKALPSTIPAALSSLTPIPLKDLNKKLGATSAAPTVSTNTGSISIQVPLQGANGTTIMQTINVPKSVLANASERPVVLTVTPKNGLNKGQKQIVMLTKNASGFGASLRTMPTQSSSVQPGAESPSKVMLTQRALPVNSSNSVPVISRGSKPTDIKALLSQVKPVPTSELAGKVIVSNPVNKSAQGLLGGNNAANPPQRAVFLQAQGQPSEVKGGQQTAGNSGARATVVQRQIVQQHVRPGQLINNSSGQQIVQLQDGKRVILQQSRAAVAGSVTGAVSGTSAVAGTSEVAGASAVVGAGATAGASSLDSLPTARIVLTQKGQVLQGAQAQALVGKIINTSQGQFIVGPNGQLLSTQKLIQNHLSNQPVRYVSVSQGGSVSGTNTAVSGASVVRSLPQNTGVQNLSPMVQTGTGGSASLQSITTNRVAQVSSMSQSLAGRGTTMIVSVPGASHTNLSATSRTLTTIASSNQTTTTVASSSNTPGRVTVAIPLIHNNSPGQAQSGIAISPVKQKFIGQPVSNTGGTGTTVLYNTVPGSNLPPGGVRNAAGIPLRSLTSTPSTVSQSTIGGATGSQSQGAGKNNSAFNQMFLNALSNRGLLSQQNGKFVYVGDSKSGATGSPSVGSGTSTVSIPLSSLGLNAGTTTPNSGASPGRGAPSSSNFLSGGVTANVNQANKTPEKSVVQVVVSAPSLDSFTASPRLLRMASSLMENPTIAELINTPCETSNTQNLNGDINIYGVKTPDSVTTSLQQQQCDIKNATPVHTTPVKAPRTFYYRNPRLPAGWYVGVDVLPNNLSANVSFYTSNGERLRSPSEVAHYLKNKLVLLPSCKNIPPPAPITEIPLASDLTPENKVFVSELVLPVVDASSPLIRQIETEIITSPSHHPGKRSGLPIGNPVEQKKSKIVFF